MDELKQIAKTHGAKLEFNPSLDETTPGQFFLKEKKIEINPNLSRGMQIYAFFHELAHFRASAEGKWKRYHDPGIPFSEKRKFGLRVERAMDKFAIKETKKYFPEVEIQPLYAGAAGKRNFNYYADKTSEPNLLDDI